MGFECYCCISTLPVFLYLVSSAYFVRYYSCHVPYDDILRLAYHASTTFHLCLIGMVYCLNYNLICILYITYLISMIVSLRSSQCIITNVKMI